LGKEVVSSFAWLDVSERDRRRALDIIDLFQQKETVDELGIGSIRDVIADVLSPGTSTIQTRARYFFFVPWAYLGLERRSDLSDVGEKARRAESVLIPRLLESEDSEGAIGRLAGASVKRLPSSVYWAGLGRLGFRLFNGSRDQYHRELKHGRRGRRADDTNDVSLDVSCNGYWHPNIPEPPEDFPRNVSFKLTREEANFFLGRLEFNASGSLLQFLVQRRQPTERLNMPWQHPDLAVMPVELRQWLNDAMCYSGLMHGAQLLYNLMLAEKRGVKDWLTDYQERFGEWVAATDANIGVYQNWQQPDFWRRLRSLNSRLPVGAERFSKEWISQVLSARHATDLMHDTSIRSLIAFRERTLKGPRARLESQSHLEVWGGTSGAAPLDYRWAITQTIANDILAGLEN
jgi:hypothetical protein